MTKQERWLVTGVALLILFGSGARWFRFHRTSSHAKAERRVASETQPRGKAARAAGGRIDLDRCGEEALRTLPGIGAVKARRIARYLAAHRPIGAIGELEAIDGIGQATIRRIRPLVTCGACEEKKAARRGPPGGDERAQEERRNGHGD